MGLPYDSRNTAGPHTHPAFGAPASYRLV